MRSRPLALAFLVALLGHGLWLAHAQLRQRRQPLPQTVRSRDDSPELLVFSRLPPESLAPAPIPLPPESGLPPPPPPLPEQQAAAASDPGLAGRPVPPEVSSSGNPRGGAQPSRKGAPRSGRSPVERASSGGIQASAAKSRGATFGGARPATTNAAARRPAGQPQTAQPQKAQLQAAVPSTAGKTRTSPTADAGEEAALPPLRLLQEARRQGTGRSVGEKLQAWRGLWQAADPDASPPAALEGRGEGVDLRRIPMARAQVDGLQPSHGEVLRLDDHLLLTWIEGSQLWLLRAPI